MNILEITSRDFRSQQKKWFELADRGVQVIIKRGNKHAYVLTSVEAGDIAISSKMSQKIQEATADYTHGRAHVSKNIEELNSFLDNL